MNTNQLLEKEKYGSVYPYEDKGMNKQLIVKHICADDFTSLKRALNEVTVGLKCLHPCILPVETFDLVEVGRKQNLYVLFERMKYSLEAEMKQYRTYIPEEKIIKYAYDIICGLEHLHSREFFIETLNRKTYW